MGILRRLSAGQKFPCGKAIIGRFEFEQGLIYVRSITGWTFELEVLEVQTGDSE